MQAASVIDREEAPFRLERSGDLAPLREALRIAGYSQPALAETAKVQDSGGRLDSQVVLRRTADPTPYNTLARLFFLGQPVATEKARAALAPMELERLFTLGLLKITSGGVRSEARLMPFEDLFVVHDFNSDVTGQPLLPNHVLGVGAASVTLANLTVRREGESVLDLGTGSGIQALLASRHAAHVIATDTNRRALNFAGLNALLNGKTNIEPRQGSLYEPVEGRRFDLIVANPPFVISPESRYHYRDSNLPGDQISEQVIRGAAARLQEGGYCVVLCNWHHRDHDWSERPRQWVASSGCDAWLLCFKTDDPLSYAAIWLRATEADDSERYGRLLDTWLRYYEEMGIGWISYGTVVLRRRSAPANWVRADMAPPDRPAGSCSAQTQRIFAAQDFLAELHDDHQLLDHALALAPEQRMEHVLKAEGGGWTVTEALLKPEEGLQFTGRIDRLVSTMLAGCDGRHPLRELVADLAGGLGMNFEDIAPACLSVARRLMELGFLVVDRRGLRLNG